MKGKLKMIIDGDGSTFEGENHLVQTSSLSLHVSWLVIGWDGCHERMMAAHGG